MTLNLLIELLPFPEAARTQLEAYHREYGVSSYVDELRMLFNAHDSADAAPPLPAATTAANASVAPARLSARLRENRDECWARIAEREDALEFYLYFCTLLVAEAEERYSARFGYEAYLRIARDLVRWSESCYRRNGCYGLEEYRWFERMLDNKIVELGVLQFEMCKLSEISEKKIEQTLKEGIKERRPAVADRDSDDVIKVHIPAGAHFSPCNIQEALTEAWLYFGTSRVYICHSWLLDPALAQLLPEGSNISYFQSLFDLIGVNYCARQAEDLLFVRASSDLGDYRSYLASIEASSLQKNALAYLEAGNKLGLGLGVLKVGVFKTPA